MGSDAFNESNPYQYQIFKTKPKPGETGILVRPDSIEGLAKKNSTKIVHAAGKILNKFSFKKNK